MSRMRLAGALLAVVFAMHASAQAPLPSDFSSDVELERARLCRAAAYFHLDGPLPNDATVPRSVALTLVDQLQFIFAEGLLNKPIANVDDGQAIVAFAERWLLDFNRTLAVERDRLSELSRREAVLMDCVPWVWSTARSFVDHLISWRLKARDDPPFPTAEAIQRQFDEMARRLELKDD